MRSRWTTPALVLALVAVLALSFLGRPSDRGPDAHASAGSDDRATALLTGHGVVPWTTPLFSLSAEGEAGLLALQAALGAGVLGFALGHLRGRATARPEDRPRADADG
ncbi:MAG: energy-coupling factor ABC transporter substrate-binding protein [Micropruina sp.]|nr:energy-coupling factor ABC transporter substrate-binding protein [Micropruina sp.]